MTHSRARARTWSAWLPMVAVVLLGGAVAALANDNILHEYFLVPASEESAGPRSTSPAETPSGAEELSASLGGEDGEVDPAGAQPPPPLNVENSGDELVYEPDGKALDPTGAELSEHNGPSDADDPATLDRETSLDASLSYYAVFNPSVAPWKRVSTRNQVNEGYRLTVQSPHRRIEVRDRPVRAGYERFWGSMLVRMEEGRPISLPTVAAQVDILRYQTEPPINLSFQHEYLADNYYVSGDYTGTVRINFLLEAHESYFGGEVSPDLEIDDLPAAMRPRVPPKVAKAAERAIEIIGVDRRGSFKSQLDALVGWFRAFEARPFPEALRGDDIYLDLVEHQLGVCRHRALAFVVTAQALGIAARYVFNEAHAFVEVYVPRRGWMRIDLGGAAVDFEMKNTVDKTLHLPPEPDTLPQPDGFSSSYSHRVGTGQQEADVDGDGDGESIEGVPVQTTGQRLRAADEPQSTPTEEGMESADVDPAEDPLPFPARADGESAEPGAAPAAGRRATLLSLVGAPKSGPSHVFRGDRLEVKGRLTTDQGLPLGTRPVQAYLVPAGRPRPELFRQVGEGKTDEDGYVTVEVTIPETTDLGLWSVYLFFLGDENFERSHSE